MPTFFIQVAKLAIKTLYLPQHFQILGPTCWAKEDTRELGNQTWMEVVVCYFGWESRLLGFQSTFPNPCLYLVFPFQIEDIKCRKLAKARKSSNGLPALLTRSLGGSLHSKKKHYINLILWPGVNFSEITPYLILMRWRGKKVNEVSCPVSFSLMSAQAANESESRDLGYY